VVGRPLVDTLEKHPVIKEPGFCFHGNNECVPVCASVVKDGVSSECGGLYRQAGREGGREGG